MGLLTSMLINYLPNGASLWRRNNEDLARCDHSQECGKYC